MMRAFVIFILITVFYVVNSRVLIAQTATDYQYIENIISKESINKIKTNYFYQKPNNISGYVSLCFFKIYKSWFSSQDANKCPFEPSCSLYMLHSLQEKGAFSGLLNGLDRFMRCNGHDLDKYQVNSQTGKLIDPVE